jgi:hypothetical protein
MRLDGGVGGSCPDELQQYQHRDQGLSIRFDVKSTLTTASSEAKRKKLGAQWMMVVGESGVTQAGILDAQARSLGCLKLWEKPED